MVDALIRENRELKRQLSRLEAAAARPQQPPVLRTLHRRLEQALDEAGTRPAARPAPRRRITDPAILEKRREALARARQALAEKRASAAASSSE
jgi:hypothetical protein